ncbi:MAG TPA: spore germination protein [Bacillota bacterium]|nr:spore germination protein [Bacillota bacterium]
MSIRSKKPTELNIIQSLIHEAGNPADLRIMPFGRDLSAYLIYLNSLIPFEKYHDLIDRLPQEWLGRNQPDPPLTHETLQTNLSITEAVEKMLAGHLLMIIPGASRIASLDVQGWLRREPKEPQTERLIRGPREGFVETLEDNIGMIRRWIQDPKLKIIETVLGRRTKTRVVLMYLADIAQPRLVTEVTRRLKAIKIDGILESGYIEQLISDRRASIFPLTQATERSDKAASAILEGRVVILVDKSPSSIIVPTTINEMYQTPEDYYFNFWIGSFLRLIRLLGNNLAVVLPGLYIALAAYHPELLPTQLALSIAGTASRVPLPLIAEVLLLEIMVEVFREAGLRLPGAVGQTLGVVAGIVLGLSAVQAGFISPATLAVVSITAIASFTGPNYSVDIAWRLLKFIMLFAAAVLGLYGIILSGLAILIHAADLNSFGVSYLAPWAPLQWRALKDGPFRMPFWARLYRPETWRPQDTLRSGGTKGEDDD